MIYYDYTNKITWMQYLTSITIIGKYMVTAGTDG